MDNLQPVVSVIIPCFNQGATLDEAVASVLDQTFTDFEIVIVNDGSTDRFTNELLASYHRPKTRVIVTPNQGLAEARNTAIRHSRGKYILPLDADDRIRREYLARAVQVLEANPDVVIAYSDVERFGDETGLVELPEFSRSTMLFRNLIFCAAFFRRGDYDETRGYRNNLRSYEDWDLWLSLLELRPRGRVIKIPKTLFDYRVRANSMLHSMPEADRRRSRLNLFLNHVALYERYGIDPIGLYSADKELEAQCAELENQYREIRSSAEYRIGSFLLKPLERVSAVIARERFYRSPLKFSSRNTPQIKAIPNPMRLHKETGLGETTLAWWPGLAKTVEIHVDAPDGPLFVRADHAGDSVTGKWVRDGMTFYLQDVTNGLPLTAANTLAATQVDGVTGNIVARTASSMRRATRATGATGAKGWMRSQVAPSGLILMYHRVTESPKDSWQLNVSKRNFDGHLEVLRRTCRPWPLRRALQALKDGNLPPRTVVVTFDDGYRDNFLNAQPLLEKHDVPATLFLTSGYLEAPQGFWWDELERILSGEELSPVAFQSVYNRLQLMTARERQAELDKLRDESGIPGTPALHPVLSREEVAAIDRSGLIEIGSHTETHPLLPTLPLGLQREEIVRGKRELESLLGHSVTSFAYPYGQYDAATVGIVEEAGFHCGCSTDAGILTPEADRFRLPRVQVTDCGPEEFARRVSDCFER